MKKRLPPPFDIEKILGDSIKPISTNRNRLTKSIVKDSAPITFDDLEEFQRYPRRNPKSTINRDSAIANPKKRKSYNGSSEIEMISGRKAFLDLPSCENKGFAPLDPSTEEFNLPSCENKGFAPFGAPDEVAQINIGKPKPKINFDEDIHCSDGRIFKARDLFMRVGAKVVI
jgi:hypothetical protein